MFRAKSGVKVFSNSHSLECRRALYLAINDISSVFRETHLHTTRLLTSPSAKTKAEEINAAFAKRSTNLLIPPSSQPPNPHPSRVIARSFQVCVPICDGTEGSCPCDHLCLPKRFELQGEPHTTEVFLCRPPDAGECFGGGGLGLVPSFQAVSAWVACVFQPVACVSPAYGVGVSAWQCISACGVFISVRGVYQSVARVSTCIIVCVSGCG